MSETSSLSESNTVVERPNPLDSYAIDLKIIHEDFTTPPHPREVLGDLQTKRPWDFKGRLETAATMTATAISALNSDRCPLDDEAKERYQCRLDAIESSILALSTLFRLRVPMEYRSPLSAKVVLTALYDIQLAYEQSTKLYHQIVGSSNDAAGARRHEIQRLTQHHNFAFPTQTATHRLSRNLPLEDQRPCTMCNPRPALIDGQFHRLDTICEGTCYEVFNTTETLRREGLIPQISRYLVIWPYLQTAIATRKHRDFRTLFEKCNQIIGQTTSQIVQVISDTIQQTLNYVLDPRHHQPVLNRNLRLLRARYCLEHDLIPPGFELKGVKWDHDPDGISEGGEGRTYSGTYGDKTVILKRHKHTSTPAVRPGSHAYFEWLHEAKRELYPECLVWMDLTHPNIVKCLGVSLEAFSTPCIVLEKKHYGNLIDFFDHSDVKEELQDPRLRPRIRAKIYEMILNICDAVEYLHGNVGIAHGDLRGGNIVVDKDYKAFLIDFGQSVYANATSNKQHSRRGGTNLFLPPERLEGTGNFRQTYKADMWSLGLCIVEFHDPYMFQAPQVYNRQDALARLQQRSHGGNGNPVIKPKFHQGEEMDDALWKLLRKCWRISPEARPKIHDFYRDLKRIL
ncbi:kinase-like domain-containing protein [Abortiporus biennis]|nr:kinase-like domain-containing protein [Abortiporus biennis]